MGGGYQVFGNDVIETEDDPVDKETGIRKDGQNLIKKWLENKTKEGKNANTVRTRSELTKVDLATSEYLFGKLNKHELFTKHQYLYAVYLLFKFTKLLYKNF